MRKFTLTPLLVGIAFLVACCIFTNGHAQDSNAGETIRGKIEMNLPDTPKVEINLDKSLLNLFISAGIGSHPKLDSGQPIDSTEYAEMLKGASIRVYDKKMKNFNRIVDHYHKVLEDEKWEHLVKIRGKFDLSLLYAEKPGIVHGIFLRFTDDGGSGFVNIYGEIDFQKLGTLFGQLLESNSEEAVSKTFRSWVDAPPPQWLTFRNWVNTPPPQWLKVKLSSEKPNAVPKSANETNDRSK